MNTSSSQVADDLRRLACELLEQARCEIDGGNAEHALELLDESCKLQDLAASWRINGGEREMLDALAQSGLDPVHRLDDVTR